MQKDRRLKWEKLEGGFIGHREAPFYTPNKNVIAKFFIAGIGLVECRDLIDCTKSDFYTLFIENTNIEFGTIFFDHRIKDFAIYTSKTNKYFVKIDGKNVHVPYMECKANLKWMIMPFKTKVQTDFQTLFTFDDLKL